MDDLRKSSEETRYQFLMIDLKVLGTSLEMGAFELGRGNLEVARREAASLKKGIETIERLLPGVSAEQRRDVEAGLATLKGSYEGFRAKLATNGHE